MLSGWTILICFLIKDFLVLFIISMAFSFDIGVFTELLIAIRSTLPVICLLLFVLIQVETWLMPICSSPSFFLRTAVASPPIYESLSMLPMTFEISRSIIISYSDQFFLSELFIDLVSFIELFSTLSTSFSRFGLQDMSTATACLMLILLF